jgi:hypothetical protein
MAATQRSRLRSLERSDTVELALDEHEGTIVATVERVVCVGGECRVLLEQGYPHWRWRLVARPGESPTAAIRLTDGVAGWEDRGAVASLEVVARAR